MRIGARKLLLDTNALLDMVVAPERLGAEARERIEDPATGLVVSAASAWEVAIKTRQGRLPGGEHLIAGWEHVLAEVGADQLAIDVGDGIRAGGLVWAHRDPFDRMLVAQALRGGLVIATRDSAILEASIVDVLDTRV